MAKDTYEEHQKRMRKLLAPPTAMGSLTRRLEGLRLRFPKPPLLKPRIK